MEISALGAAREVGRSAFFVKGKRTRVLLDFGVLMTRQPSFPIHVQRRDVDAILLSHAHLDHSGAIPLFYLSDGLDIYATELTMELTRLLLSDFVKISGFYLPFEYLDVMSMMKKATKLKQNDEVKIGEFTAKFRDAGHIPGSSMITLEDGNKKLLYTGDINGTDTNLLKGGALEPEEFDMVITESTYATADHPPRETAEDAFVAFAKETVENGGTLFVPAFSVGRAQEVACALKSHSFPYPVAMDGMALQTNDILFRHQEYLKDPALFRKTIESLEIISSWNERKRLANTPCVIIAPAGMLVGGQAVFYTQAISTKPKNAISIVSFQVPGTPGRTLLEKGLAIVNGKPTKVKATVRRFDFSSHSGKKELFDMLGKVKGSPKILTVHGEEPSCLAFAQEIKEKMGFDADAPQAGQTFNI
ncbi:MAG: MBL fold metallo-hydrolase [Thaumarchaeota archaeon]|nr:MBL fold metallo-hydrolase [Nitrososphaerota archaeon]